MENDSCIHQNLRFHQQKMLSSFIGNISPKKVAGNFPAGRWTRVFRPAQTATLLFIYMFIVRKLFPYVNEKSMNFYQYALHNPSL